MKTTEPEHSLRLCSVVQVQTWTLWFGARLEGLNRRRRRVRHGSIAALTRQAEAPTIEVALYRHAANVAAEAGADLRELLRAEDRRGDGGARKALAAAALDEHRRRDAQLAEAIVAPAVSRAARDDAAALHDTRADLDELEVRRDASAGRCFRPAFRCPSGRADFLPSSRRIRTRPSRRS